jgi:phage/plasmid-like protein (TIGR03299 family)
LRDGKRIWALADCGDEFDVGNKGRDIVKRNILLSTSYDGSMATIVEPTTVRVVCQNTLGFAVGANGENAKVRISHHSEFDPSAIRADLLAAERDMASGWEEFKNRAKTLANRKVSMDEAVAFFVTMFGKPDEDGNVDIENKYTQRTLGNVIELYQNGQGQETLSAQGTAWGLVNTVTRWTDHERNSRTDAGRLNSAFFGDGADTKAQAVEVAMALAA